MTGYLESVWLEKSLWKRFKERGGCVRDGAAEPRPTTKAVVDARPVASKSVAESVLNRTRFMVVRLLLLQSTIGY